MQIYHLKSNLDNLLKKEVAALLSTNLSTFFDCLEDPLKVDVPIVPNDKLIVNIPNDSNEENQKVSTVETYKETLEWSKAKRTIRSSYSWRAVS